MGTQIQRYDAQELTFDQMLITAKNLAASGYFKDVTDAAQAFAKMMFGRELGLGPGASMQKIYAIVVGGRTFLEPHYSVIASRIDAHPDYDYQVTELENDRCTIEFYYKERLRGAQSFERADAIRSGVVNNPPWKSDPQTMYFATCLRKGARKYAAFAVTGILTLTDDDVLLGLAEEDASTIDEPDASVRRRMEAREALRMLADDFGVDVAVIFNLLKELGYTTFESDMLETYHAALKEYLEVAHEVAGPDVTVESTVVQQSINKE